MSVYLQDPDVLLYQGDAISVLAQLPSASVDCIVTSPPYYGLRDYGTGVWVGGDPDCQHEQAPRTLHTMPPGSQKQASNQGANAVTSYGDCACGAQRVDHQIGLEETPEAYLDALVSLLREARRVLANHGTCWVNLGDSYASGQGQDRAEARPGATAIVGSTRRAIQRRPSVALAQKNLLGMPWRLALALQADGWLLRRDVIWSKPNPMPESVADRPTTAHEYLFLLTKRARYWYDGDAIREAHAEPERIAPAHNSANPHTRSGFLEGTTWVPAVRAYHPAGRNAYSVWTIPTQPTPDAHFATFPEELVRRCVLAGCAEWVCRECGKPRERLLETTYEPHGPSARSGSDYAGERSQGDLAHGRFRPQEMEHGRATKIQTTIGWSDCGHQAWRQGIVLDPFIGSGTTCKVARDHARRSIGIDLNADYLALASRRLAQQSIYSLDGALA